MHLISISLFGFKSFPTRTDLLLSPGITAVVGPNGCGKSNVVDAVRWALGEQRPTQLRGERMEDVVFNGTQFRRPLGLAEISLTLDNSDGELPLEFREVTVTRKLYRNGDSEYLVNRLPYRLREIQQLLYDTGIGVGAYSLIKQGDIDAILSDRPEDRRAIFEEAAEIMRYRTSKRQAESKLETNSQLLVRISDRLALLEDQLGSLERQAARAEKYRRLAVDLREKGLLRAVLTGHRLAEESARVQREVEEAHRVFENANQAVVLLESTREENLLAKGELERKIMTSGAALAELRSQAVVLDRERSHLTSRIASAGERQNELAAHLATLRQKEEGLHEEETRLGKESTRLEEAWTVADVKVHQAEEAVVAAETAGLAVRRQEGELSKAAETGLQRLNSLTTRRDRIEALLRADTETLRRISGELADLDTQLATLAENAIQCRATREATEAEAVRLRADLSEQELSLTALRQKIQTGEQGLAELQAQVKAVERNLQLLQEMEKRLEGFGQGASLLAKSNPAGFLPFANQLRVLEGAEAAVESALGALLPALLPAESVDLAAALDLLTTKRAGPTPLILRSVVAASDPPGPVPEGTRPLLEVIEAEPDILDIARRLLGNVLLAPEREQALALLRSGCPWNLVTPAGERFSPEGIVWGGSGASEGSVLARGTQARKLKQELEATLTSIAARQTELATWRAERDRHAADLAERKSLLDNAEKALADALARERELDFQEKVTRRRWTELGSDRTAVTERQAPQELELADAVREATSLSEEMTEMNRRREEALATLREAEGTLRQASTQLSACRLEALQLENDRANARKDSERVRVARTENAAEQTRTEQESVRSHQQSTQDARTIEELTEQLGTLSTQVADREAEGQALRGKLQGLSESLGRMEAELAKARSESRRAQDESHELELFEREAQVKREELFRSVREEFELEEGFLESQIAALKPDDETPDPKELDRQVQRLRNQIAELGDVNLEAAATYEAAKEEVERQRIQRDDLLSAERTLRQTIAKLDKEATERFLTTFEQIQSNFKAVFAELFPDGEAELALSNPDEPFESDILIEARPSGKRVLRITQLSGGERALVALSLLFGVYLVKPSPFCLLDEVDAPLDDANIQRFLTMLRRFSKRSQFLVITHNKRTMEIADQIIGVTMEEPGVSKVVHLSMERLDSVLVRPVADIGLL